jgi:hypothetical protein
VVPLVWAFAGPRKTKTGAGKDGFLTFPDFYADRIQQADNGGLSGPRKTQFQWGLMRVVRYAGTEPRSACSRLHVPSNRSAWVYPAVRKTGPRTAARPPSDCTIERLGFSCRGHEEATSGNYSGGA